MKKVLVFVVYTNTGEKACYIYREYVDSIEERYTSVIEWAKEIFKGCEFLEVVDAIVVDDVAIRCLI